MRLPLKYSNVSRKAQNNIIDDLLVKLDIAGHREKYPYELSGGECQRVAIARALDTDPDLILADEPTGALDSETESMIINIMKNLNRSGKTIVIVTHDLKVAKSCNRIITLCDGVVMSECKENTNL
ncbi:ABC transporter ATP-binding protein [Fusibacter sp. JL216-2]|uniref:ABC transporter ATP-binding protein n=1 Tax=Fusibacter sp. JL216-2 TaxID=3071453 RepID=UPI003D345583